MKPIVRWTIGKVKPAGYDCLLHSIINFRKLYDVDIIVYYNGNQKLHFCDTNLGIQCINQSEIFGEYLHGVAWKLYPPRVNINCHELFIDNDLIIENRIEEIDYFFNNTDCTLLLEGLARNYGKFDNHVPKNYKINSGLFGIPPGFNLNKYIQFYGDNWDSKFNEQGLVAMALLSNKKHIIISDTKITNCETKFKPSLGMHFIGLNRSDKHQPWVDYKLCKIPIYL